MSENVKYAGCFLQTALMSLKEWLAPAVPLLMCRFCGTTPNSTALGPLLKSICQQICYCDMLPFEVFRKLQLGKLNVTRLSEHS